MIEITLRRRNKEIAGIALVDDEDADLAFISWHLSARGYAMNLANKRRMILHRIIVERVFGAIPVGHECDHINRQKLDNRRANLRIVTHQNNSRNRRTWQRSDRPSKYRGVCWSKHRNIWTAQITIDGYCHKLGRYQSEVEAAMAYDAAAIAHCGQFAQPNFQPVI